MAVIVLVHGAYHGAWCWSRMVPLLEAEGHRVITPDLPGHGDDATPLASVSLMAYAEAVAVTVLGADDPVVLVGHSMAGAVIAQAAELVPEGIDRLVFLTAYVPADGETVTDCVRQDTNIRVPVERVNHDGTDCLRLDDEVLRRHFYFDALDEDFAWTRDRIGMQPLAPFIEPLRLTESRFGRLYKSYIHCRNDRAIGFSLQLRMAERAVCRRPVRMSTGHSPFITAPRELLMALLRF